MTDAMFCGGYLFGFVDAHQVTSTLNGGKQLFCLPEGGISAAQGIRIETKWLQDHPEQLHESARISVLLPSLRRFLVTNHH